MSQRRRLNSKSAGLSVSAGNAASFPAAVAQNEDAEEEKPGPADVALAMGPEPKKRIRKRPASQSGRYKPGERNGYWEKRLRKALEGAEKDFETRTAAKVDAETKALRERLETANREIESLTDKWCAERRRSADLAGKLRELTDEANGPPVVVAAPPKSWANIRR